MNDIIQLLPDNIANQIAAGEVIQRPASVVKELMENSIDAGASEIKLILKDAGKTLVQVIDTGKGMSVSDARLSFERHATSKIREANDLFQIKTMGFRGEALASIASIAQVEMITRRSIDEVGTRIVMEGSKVVRQEPVQAPIGTSISVKNLFYNIPARRKFLKSDPVELKHILDEFQRVALAYPDVFFTMHHNNFENFHLPKSNLRQRIVNIAGKLINEKLIPIQEQIDGVTISGFIVRPEGCKRTKGDQYLFVNRRFIKSTNINHAIRAAYENLLNAEQFPGYFLFLDLDPSSIDINVHPTKTEIKFEDERLMYNYIKVSVKHGLGQYSLAPMLDFEADSNFTQSQRHFQPAYSEKESPFEAQRTFPGFSGQGFNGNNPSKEKIQSWDDMYRDIQKQAEQPPFTHLENENAAGIHEELEFRPEEKPAVKTPFQIHQSYIVTQIKSGILIIDQQAAHERILYEHYKGLLSTGEFVSQKELFPRVVEMDGSKSSVMRDILPYINGLGFEISDFGNHSFIIHGTPAGLDPRLSVDGVLDKIIEQYMINYEFDFGMEDNIARSMAVSASIKKGKSMDIAEMTRMVDQLFACEMPFKSPSGKNCFITLELEEIQKRFNL